MAGRRATGDLFEAAGRERAGVTAPLAERLRPESLDEVVGQEALLAPDALLRREVQAGRLASLILWGPPGCGKTTLARLLAAEAGFELVRISAVSAGVAEVRRVLADASSRLGGSGRRTLFFVDEIHRFHKGQQDALLHEVEDGRVVLADQVPKSISLVSMTNTTVNGIQLFATLQTFSGDRVRIHGQGPLERVPQGEQLL